MNPVSIYITLRSALPCGHPGNTALLDFAQRLPECVINRDKRGWHALFSEGEAETLKHRLRSHGFNDPDFQIRVEYQRGWGFL